MPEAPLTNAMLLSGKKYYDAQCASCHGSEGLGGSTKVALIGCSTCDSRAELQVKIDLTMPLSDPKMCSTLNGCGELTAAYIFNKFSVNVGGSLNKSGYSLNQIELLSPQQTLRKASLNIVNRLPSAAEQLLVDTSGNTGLDAAFNSLLSDAQFYERLAEMYNDVIMVRGLTDADTQRDIAYKLDRKIFPDAIWGEVDAMRPLDMTRGQALDGASRAFMKAPLELVKYIAKNNLSFTQILTADYIMVNPYSAKSYGVYDDLGFTDFEADWKNTAENNWKPTKATNQAHAGVLTDSAYLMRYPTTATNKNRHRARMVYQHFLTTDILAISGNRKLSDDDKSIYPTKENPQCSICHSIMDPLASNFFNWGMGSSVAGNLHQKDMFDAGFESLLIPLAEEKKSLQWVAKQIVADDRFALAQVENVYKSITGQDKFLADETSTQAQKDATLVQSEYFKILANNFESSNYNIKVLVKDILMSPYFRAKAISPSFTSLHAGTGTAQLLTPRMLDDKIFALLGVRWTANGLVTGEHMLFGLPDNRTKAVFDLLYGGINFNDVTERVRDPNSMMTAIQDKMAIEVGCRATNTDFFYSQDKRRMFIGIEKTTLPTTPENIAAIKAAIKKIHLLLWAEANDADIEAAYELFTTIQVQGKALNLGGTMNCRLNNDPLTGASLATADRITNDPDYILRSWGAVIAYMLMDYRFLNE